MFTDGRTWLTLLYFVLMLPLGVIYFTLAVTLLSLSLSLIWAPVAAIFSGDIPGVYVDGVNVLPMAASPLVAITVAAAGALLLLLTMHLARGIGKLHGLIARTCWCGCNRPGSDPCSQNRALTRIPSCWGQSPFRWKGIRPLPGISPPFAATG